VGWSAGKWRAGGSGQLGQIGCAVGVGGSTIIRLMKSDDGPVYVLSSGKQAAFNGASIRLGVNCAGGACGKHTAAEVTRLSLCTIADFIPSTNNQTKCDTSLG
jgi:hypothetical protein